MTLRPLAFALVLPCTALADVNAVIETHILPGYEAFEEATAALATTADGTCAVDDVKPAYHTAFDAWMGVSHLQFGPVEDDGRMLKIAYWPDSKNSTAKALARLSAAQDPAVSSEDEFAEVSIAAQGLFAMERLLYDPQPDAAYACALTRAVAKALANTAAEINDGWPAFAELMRTPGAEGNDRFLSQKEVEGTLYTSLLTGLEFIKDTRLGRPMGTFDRPRPTRAEAYRSDRSQRNVLLGLEALRALADALSELPTPQVDATFAEAIDRAASLDDPAFAGVGEPMVRFRMEALQNVISTVSSSISDEIGLPMGLSAGFNALDGD